MRTHYFSVLALGLALTVPSAVGADAGPLEVVEEYLSLDFEGARLSSESWPTIVEFITWEVEPGWDTVIVVEGFRVHEPTLNAATALVPVSYDVAGIWSGDRFYLPDEVPPSVTELSRKARGTEFRLQLVENTWRIVHPRSHPHVSVQSLIDHLKKLAPETRSAEFQSSFQRLVDASAAPIE